MNERTPRPQPSFDEIQSRREFILKLGGHAAFIGAGVAFGPLSALAQTKPQIKPLPPANYTWRPDAINRPVGMAKGINPGRVVWVHDPKATFWGGDTLDLGKAWWVDSATDQNRVDRMVANAVTQLTGTSDEPDAWKALFVHFNSEKRGEKRGYQPGEGVAVKINMNGAGGSPERTNLMSDANPHVVLAVVRQLVEKAGVRQEDIMVYEAAPNRYMQTYILRKVASAFPQVRFLQQSKAEAVQSAMAQVVSADYIEAIDYSNQGNQKKARMIPRQIDEATYIINVPMLKGHSNPHNGNEPGNEGLAGVTLSGKNHFGSIFGPHELHGLIQARTPHEYSPIVDLAASPRLGGKTVLFLMDGLYCGRRHLSFPQHFPHPPFNNKMEPYENPDWPASILASQDGVALDSVALDILFSQSQNNIGADGKPRMAIRENASSYLKEMASPNPSPSGIVYKVNGQPIESLGVHENWNNDTDRQYSRNLDPVNGKGIELVYRKV